MNRAYPTRYHHRFVSFVWFPVSWPEQSLLFTQFLPDAKLVFVRQISEVHLLNGALRRRLSDMFAYFSSLLFDQCERYDSLILIHNMSISHLVGACNFSYLHEWLTFLLFFRAVCTYIMAFFSDVDHFVANSGSGHLAAKNSSDRCFRTLLTMAACPIASRRFCVHETPSLYLRQSSSNYF